MIIDEKDHQLIQNFAHFYSRPLYVFSNSKHVFDREDSIEPLIEELNMTYGGNKIKNYCFIDSIDNQFIQLSDIIVGFIGKFYNFLNDNSFDQIIGILARIDQTQRETLQLFHRILFESNKRNKAYIFLSISNDERRKMELLKNYD